MSDPDAETAPARRPFSVTALAWLVLCFAALNLVRLIEAVQKWRFLAAWLPFSPLYLASSGLVWGVAGLALAWGVWRRKPWSLRGTLVYFLIYSLYYWADRFVLSGYPDRNQNALFIALVNLAILGWIAWVVRRRKVRAYMGVKDERQPENTNAA
jgi:hypothetical protein